jgi:hypothetical protein
MRIRTSIDIDKLKRQGPPFHRYVDEKIVYINKAQLGTEEGLYLGWIHKAHLAFAFRDGMTEQLQAMMNKEFKDIKYALFPRTMCATTLSFQECEDIRRPVINAILPKMGINRKAARAVVFGKVQFGGLGLDHLATLQGHSRLQYLLGHIRCGDHTGQLVRIIIEYTQLECSTMENILEQDYDRFSNCIINKIWITEIWQHLHSCNAKVAVQQKWKPRLGRFHDT